MLSRIAESLFWIGRYVERADDTARILDAQLQLLLEDPWVEEDLACRSLLAVMGSDAPPEGILVTRQNVLELLAYDRRSPGAIAGALTAARENARRAREVLSSELWEALNATWNSLPGRIRHSTPPDFFAWIRERAALVGGVVDATTPRLDPPVPRARPLDRARRHDRPADLGTHARRQRVAGVDHLLRSCGAHEAYLAPIAGEADRLAAEFMLLDPSFPRSVLFSLERAERALAELERGGRRGGEDDARTVIGRIRSRLEYRPMVKLLGNLPEEMEDVQRACSEASDAIKLRYFPSSVYEDWIGDPW